MIYNCSSSLLFLKFHPQIVKLLCGTFVRKKMCGVKKNWTSVVILYFAYGIFRKDLLGMTRRENENRLCDATGGVCTLTKSHQI